MKFSKLRIFAQKRAKKQIKNLNILEEYLNKKYNLDILKISKKNEKICLTIKNLQKTNFTKFFSEKLNSEEKNFLKKNLINGTISAIIEGTFVSFSNKGGTYSTYIREYLCRSAAKKALLFLIEPIMQEINNFLHTPYPWSIKKNYIDYLYNFDKDGNLLN